MQDKKNLYQALSHEAAKTQSAQSTWYQLLDCFTVAERSLDKIFMESFGCLTNRYDVLTALVRQPDDLTMSELAAQLQVTNATVTGVVSRLESKGYAKRYQSKDDKRSRFVRITAKGQQYWSAMNTAYEEQIERLFKGFSARETKKIQRAISMIRNQIIFNINSQESDE